MVKISERLMFNEDGQTMAEYAVVLTVVSLGILAAIGILSGTVINAVNRVTGLI
jgi:Flp pilus assembly pilin Flp